MAMSRVRLTLIALGMAIAVPAPTGAGLSLPVTTGAGLSSPMTSVPEPAACTPQPDSDDSDTRWVWRLRAYRHLDCVDAIVERALSAPSRDRIELSRRDLERIRIEASHARAAAARMD
jgi:hypothetical protein